MSKFLGTGVALVTPFNADLSIDHEALANIVNYNIDHGVEYLVICGTTGESVTLTKQEKKQVSAAPLLLGSCKKRELQKKRIKESKW